MDAREIKEKTKKEKAKIENALIEEYKSGKNFELEIDLANANTEILSVVLRRNIQKRRFKIC